MKLRARRGSALITAIVFGTVILLTLAALLTTVNNEYRSSVRGQMKTEAFHLAEAGVDSLARAIDRDKLGELTDNTQKQTGIPLGNVTGSFVAVVTPDNPTAGRYTVRSLGRVRHSNGLEVEQAVEVIFSKSPGSGASPGFALAAKNSISFNESGNSDPTTHIRVASYDSSNGLPDWAFNRGFDAGVGVGSANNNAIQLNNAIIDGVIKTGGGSVANSVPDTSNSWRSPTLNGPNTDTGVQFDTKLVGTDFDYAFPDPVTPPLPARPTGGDQNMTATGSTSAGDPIYYVGQNDNARRNLSNTTIGRAGTTTYYYYKNTTATANGGLKVLGNVIIIIDQQLNIQGSVDIPAGSTLQIYSNDKVHLDMVAGSWAPSSLVINIAKAGEVVTHVGNGKSFSGIINAPNSTVRIHGEGSNGVFRGSAIGADIDLTNGVDVFYDIRTGGGQSTTKTLTLSDWKQILPSVVKAQLPAGFVL
ncbi:hypothetical protein DB347_12925 [Opitutaceae bacterium EW11]|nr:hypothetical protein DB347_12925 [Opitutaceae bacterium EW11]